MKCFLAYIALDCIDTWQYTDLLYICGLKISRRNKIVKHGKIDEVDFVHNTCSPIKEINFDYVATSLVKNVDFKYSNYCGIMFEVVFDCIKNVVESCEVEDEVKLEYSVRFLYYYFNK